MNVLERKDYRVINLTDGNKIREAANMVVAGKADGVNFNYITNFPSNINEIKLASNIKYVQINLYPKSWEYDYRAINELKSLEGLDVFTYDRCEIDYSNYPNLRTTCLYWRPKAASLYNCAHLKRLFLGKYTEKDLSKLVGLEELEYLRINTGSVRSLQGIERLQNLEVLKLMQATKLEEIKGIEKLPKLKEVRIDNCKNIKDIDLTLSLNKKVDVRIYGTTPLPSK